MEKRRRNQQESSIGSETEFPTEDFDFDNKKKDSRFFSMSIIAVLLIFFSFLFFSSSASSQLRARNANPSAIESIRSELDLQSKVDAIIKPVELKQNLDERIPVENAISKLKLMTELNTKCQMLIEDARKLKETGACMEKDENALKIIALLQSDLKTLLRMRFGENPKLLVEIILQFPKSMPDYETAGADGRIIIEMGPIDLVPYSVYYWLEIVRRFKTGAFHRNAGHVLQAQVYLTDPVPTDHFKRGGLAFQEYNKDYPHNKLTLGYAGRPGGPAFYISTINNVGNHGPASQGSGSEADSCFGKVVEGEEIVNRMKKQPGASPPSGIVSVNLSLGCPVISVASVIFMCIFFTYATYLADLHFSCGD